MLRTFWLSLSLALLAALSVAFGVDDLHIDGIEAYLHHGQKRQASGTGNTPPPVSSSPSPASSPKPPSSTPSDTPVVPATSDEPKSSSPAQTSLPPSSANKPPSSTPTSTSRTVPPTSSPPKTTPVVFTSALVTTSLQEFTSVFVTTSNGQEVTLTSTGANEIPVTTGVATITDAPTSQSGDSGRGLSTTNKNIIGGVVGGVGGALLLGGIALVFLRMRKRQTRVRKDDDDMTLGTGSALGDKHHGNNATPFQSNLEQYHNPGGRPNAAANF